MYACLYRPLLSETPPPLGSGGELVEVANDFSPRYERHRDDLVVIDVSGLERLLASRRSPTRRFGEARPAPARLVGEELRRATVSRGVRGHVALAGTQIAAIVLAHARQGLTVVAPGDEAGALAPLAIAVLGQLPRSSVIQFPDPAHLQSTHESPHAPISQFTSWGLRTLGELAALPAADLVSRLGRPAVMWQAIARGEDIRPLVPTRAEERFESSLELEWPIEGLEPLSFVLTRLLEPLSTRLERRDRGAAVLHILLGLVTRLSTGSGREMYARRLELPSPMRDVRALRTLALLDLESHPPAAAIDRVTVMIEPTPGRVLQHTLYARPHPTPEQLSTLLARLGALMGQDRIGAATTVDTYRAGAFAMTPFRTRHDSGSPAPRDNRDGGGGRGGGSTALFGALRRCRQPVPARVAVADGRPVRVTTDRRGFAGGRVTACAGPWRTSGEWWSRGANERVSASGWDSAGGQNERVSASGWDSAGGQNERVSASVWDNDEWEVALNDGAVYRIFRDREADAWFIDGIVD